MSDSGVDTGTSEKILPLNSSHHEAIGVKMLSTRKKDLARARRMSTANDMLYPMHVLSVKELLKMKRGEHLHHQALVKSGKVIPWKASMGPVAFISHQWLSYNHADPSEFRRKRDPNLACEIQTLNHIETHSTPHNFATWQTSRSSRFSSALLSVYAKEIWSRSRQIFSPGSRSKRTPPTTTTTCTLRSAERR